MRKYINIGIVFLMAGIFKMILHIPSMGLRFFILASIIAAWFYYVFKEKEEN